MGRMAFTRLLRRGKSFTKEAIHFEDANVSVLVARWARHAVVHDWSFDRWKSVERSSCGKDSAVGQCHGSLRQQTRKGFTWAGVAYSWCNTSSHSTWIVRDAIKVGLTPSPPRTSWPTSALLRVGFDWLVWGVSCPQGPSRPWRHREGASATGGGSDLDQTATKPSSSWPNEAFAMPWNSILCRRWDSPFPSAPFQERNTRADQAGLASLEVAANTCARREGFGRVSEHGVGNPWRCRAGRHGVVGRWSSRSLRSGGDFCGNTVGMASLPK